MNTNVAKHIADHADIDRMRLPAVWSEDDDALRDDLVSELGRPVPAGYMSEEEVFELSPEEIDAAKKACGEYWWKDA